MTRYVGGGVRFVKLLLKRNNANRLCKKVNERARGKRRPLLVYQSEKPRVIKGYVKGFLRIEWWWNKKERATWEIFQRLIIFSFLICHRKIRANNMAHGVFYFIFYLFTYFSVRINKTAFSETRPECFISIRSVSKSCVVRLSYDYIHTYNRLYTNVYDSCGTLRTSL